MYWLKLSSRTPFTLWHIHKYLPWNQPRFKYHLSTLTTTKVKTLMYTCNYFDNNRDSDANVYCNYIENITHTRLLNILYICFMNWVSWCWVVINELNWINACDVLKVCHWVGVKWALMNARRSIKLQIFQFSFVHFNLVK